MQGLSRTAYDYDWDLNALNNQYEVAEEDLEDEEEEDENRNRGVRRGR